MKTILFFKVCGEAEKLRRFGEVLPKEPQAAPDGPLQQQVPTEEATAWAEMPQVRADAARDQAKLLGTSIEAGKKLWSGEVWGELAQSQKADTKLAEISKYLQWLRGGKDGSLRDLGIDDATGRRLGSEIQNFTQDPQTGLLLHRPQGQAGSHTKDWVPVLPE